MSFLATLRKYAPWWLKDHDLELELETETVPKAIPDPPCQSPAPCALAPIMSRSLSLLRRFRWTLEIDGVTKSVFIKSCNPGPMFSVEKNEPKFMSFELLAACDPPGSDEPVNTINAVMAWAQNKEAKTVKLKFFSPTGEVLSCFTYEQARVNRIWPKTSLSYDSSDLLVFTVDVDYESLVIS